MKISDNTSVAMPMRNLISIVIAVAVGVYGYFGLTERITRLETSDTLFEADLLKKADQTPKNLEIFMLIEELYKQSDKHQLLLDKNIHTQVKLDHIEIQLEKALSDLVSSQKISDCVLSNIVSFLSSKTSSFERLFILCSVESLVPSTLIAVIEPGCIRSLKTKLFLKFPG